MVLIIIEVSTLLVQLIDPDDKDPDNGSQGTQERKKIDNGILEFTDAQYGGDDPHQLHDHVQKHEIPHIGTFSLGVVVDDEGDGTYFKKSINTVIFFLTS